jgi:hypothetical protein
LAGDIMAPPSQPSCSRPDHWAPFIVTGEGAR